MTFGRWYRLFKHYRQDSDNKLSGITYQARLDKMKKSMSLWT
jgi:hypothetical protein